MSEEPSDPQTILTDETIRSALHASRVVPLGVANPHGPLGLEQLVAAVAAHCKVETEDPHDAEE